MRICFAVLYYSELLPQEPAAYLDRTPLLREVPRRLAARGHEVHLVHLFSRDAELTADGVRHHFLACGRWTRRAAALGGRLVSRQGAFLEPAHGAVTRIRRLEPDLIHFHGTILHLNLALLLRRLGRRPPPVVVHHHGGELSRRPWLRSFQCRALRRASRICFSTRAHAEPWVAAGATEPGRVVELMETSSTFRPQPRAEARRATGMSGEPVFLCAGRLHPVKDPFTVLRGFERIAAEWPRSRLYLHYLSDELLGELREWTGARPALAARTHFGGRLEPRRMEAVYNSADFLLQASRREYSGIAVLDAMACGVIPAVSDIPSFNAMTAGGRHGVLFPVGDDEALASGVLAIDRDEIPRLAAAVRRHFEEALSFAAAADRLEALYLELIDFHAYV